MLETVGKPLGRVGLAVTLWGVLATGLATEPCEPPAGQLVSVQGQIEVSHLGAPRWLPARLEQILCPGDRIHVAARSRAAVLLNNQTLLRLDQDTTVTFSKVEPQAPSWLDLLKGAVHFLSRVPQRLDIRTPFVNAGIEGTEFVVRVAPTEARIWVLEGAIRASNPAGRLTLVSGEAAVAEPGKAPRRILVVKPREAVQWALYYPPVIDYRQTPYPVGPGTEGLRAALARYRAGDLPGAFNALDAVPPESRDNRYLTLRAGLLLTVGRVEAAHTAIAEALANDPQNATAWALQSVIAVAQNDPTRALELAQQTTRYDPRSPVAQVALSYAQQANFQIEKARASLEEAVRLNPENALAWARLAELWLATGYLDRALRVAKRAAALDPRLERTQTVLGFATLTQIKIDEAKTAFEQAIRLDPAAPWPHLGLGLAHIRQGKLDRGTEQMEIAALLDPDNALIRSYLGKAYYEQKRGALAATEFANAKALDPNDPTPWFYDALYKQTVNRPVEALHAMQRAIALNDNRAVYRSRLLLDQDLAARSANLARIYADLGFRQLALIQGWKSVNTDPANDSAHRLLSDVYATLPRHEIARVSELLQAQLLQPINITPLQPQLGSVNLAILEGAGPAESGFNEFNPLFVRNRAYVQAGAVGGTQATWGDNVIVSGIQDALSYSFGQFHFETTGFRDNNDQRQDLFNAFVQAEVTPKTSLQAELRRTDLERGDRALTFLESFVPTQRQEERTDGGRLGLRHAFTPNSSIIGSVIFQDSDQDTRIIPGVFELATDSEAYVGELRYLLDQTSFDVTVGAGYLDTNATTQAIFAGTAQTQTDDAKLTNAYLYYHPQVTRDIHLTLGIDANWLRGTANGEDRDQLNPKFGILWSPTRNTTLRAAAFRTLGRPFISEFNIYPTVQPTQVAGFNQFFFDAQGTRAWRYAVGLDQAFSRDVYAGAELSARDLEAEIILVSSEAPVVTHRDWKERLVRAYTYWTPHPWWAVSAEYQYEAFKREFSGLESGAEAFTDLWTQRLPLSIGLFHPSGVTSTVTATFVDQTGKFLPDRLGIDQPVPGSDDFWVLDASVGYRLPRRYGVLSLAVKNLLNENFRFQDTDPGQPKILPERVVLFQINLSI